MRCNILLAVMAAMTPLCAFAQTSDKTADVTLLHPTLVDTSKLADDARTISLFGIVGLSGQFAEDLHGALVAGGDKVTCQAQTNDSFTCLLPDGTDVAALAVRNGAAEARADAPKSYQDMESAARDERRGVWASLPPPPVQVSHSKVVNTGELVANGQTFLLDGVQGLGGGYAHDMQNYILAQGDALVCNPRGAPGHYLCLTPNGTDAAKVALVNGAARVATDAPDSYRLEQGDALDNKRGFWKHPPADVLVSMTTTAPSPVPHYAIAAGDEGSDGISYIAGSPGFVVGGETVILGFGGDALGWGYWDNYHHWRAAPDYVGRHMDRYHPGGTGLRSYAAGRPTPSHAQSFVHPAAAAHACKGHC